MIERAELAHREPIRMFVCLRCGLSYGFPMGRCGLDGEPLIESKDDPLIGRDLDRYQILEQLGSGAMARVYRARHKFLDSEFALKILLGQIACDRSLSERFRREAQAVSRIKHPNVVAVTDFGVTQEGVTFLAMELLRGRTLASALRSDGKFIPARAADVTKQIAKGLGAAQKLGFVHRDLKPGNVMMVEDQGREMPKVLDFGLVRFEDTKDDVQRLTRTGQVFGTPAYMAPEQIEGGDNVGPPADFYALGVMLYEMLTGMPPFTGGLHLVLSLHMNEPPKPIPEHGRIGELAIQLLAKKPEARPQSTDEIIARLDEAMGRSHTPKRGVALGDRPEVYESSPFVEIQKTIPDQSLAPRRPPGPLERSMIAISQKLKKSRPATLVLIGALLIGVLPGMVLAHYSYKVLSERGSRSEVPLVIEAPINPEGESGATTVGEAVPAPANPPAAAATAEKVEDKKEVAAAAVEEDDDREPARAARRSSSRSAPRSAPQPQKRESRPSGPPGFKQLDRELQAILDQRGLGLEDIASKEPERAGMWLKWRRSGNAPQNANVFCDALKEAARGYYIAKPFLKTKLERVLRGLQALPASKRAGLEDEYIGLQREVDRASSQREWEMMAMKIATLERKVARLR